MDRYREMVHTDGPLLDDDLVFFYLFIKNAAAPRAPRGARDRGRAKVH